MKVHIIKNGNIKLVITPEDAIEKAVLETLAKEPVQLTIPDRIELIDINLTDAAILAPVPVTKIKDES